MLLTCSQPGRGTDPSQQKSPPAWKPEQQFGKGRHFQPERMLGGHEAGGESGAKPLKKGTVSVLLAWTRSNEKTKNR